MFGWLFKKNKAAPVKEPEKIDKFAVAMAFVLKWEGGLSNDRLDPGGLTNFGISKRYNPEISAIEIRNLTKEKAVQIYHRKYWIPAGCENFEHPLSMAVFDAAVNNGVSRSLSFYAAAKESMFDPDTLSLTKAHLGHRAAWYRAEVKRKPYKKKFLKGWLRRVDALSKACGV